MEESLVKILTPKRRVDILRDVMQCREEQRPYVITFCGVNGVGKSTNLAKVCVCACVHVCVCVCIPFCVLAYTYVRTYLHMFVFALSVSVPHILSKHLCAM